MSAELTPATAAQILAEAEAKWAKRVERAGQDTTRLDWLAAHQASINQTAMGPHVWNGREPADNDNHFYGSTYREAVDKAMEGTK